MDKAENIALSPLAASRSTKRKEKIIQVLWERQPDLSLVLANIHDPHNVSAIYRSCDAFGVEKVHLFYDREVFPELGKKSSASARKWVETVRHSNRDDLFGTLKRQNFLVLATSFSKKAKALRNWNFLQPVAIILGNEHDGVDKSLTAMADGELYIPMHGMIQSFNVSVAAAIILAEAARQRELAGYYDRSETGRRNLEAKLNTWLEK